MTATTEGANTTRLLTSGDLATRWQVHKGHLANLRCHGEGPAYVKIGSSVRYRLADIEAYELASVAVFA